MSTDEAGRTRDQRALRTHEECPRSRLLISSKFPGSPVAIVALYRLICAAVSSSADEGRAWNSRYHSAVSVTASAKSKAGRQPSRLRGFAPCRGTKGGSG